MNDAVKDPVPEQVQQPTGPTRLLTQEERNDLRKLVLAGHQLSLEDAKAVVDTVRQGRGAAALSAESKPKKRSKKAGMADADFHASLDGKLAGL